MDDGTALNSSKSALSCVDGAALGGKSTCGSTAPPPSSIAVCDATAESTVNSSSRSLVSSFRILLQQSCRVYIQRGTRVGLSFGERALLSVQSLYELTRNTLPGLT